MKRFEELEKISMPIKEFLEKNYHPHCAVVITTEDVKVVETALRSPLSAEVSVAAKTDIKEIATCDLVEELSRREGVEITIAGPYQQRMIDVNGPAIILTVVD